jgi:hypothetical protein
MKFAIMMGATILGVWLGIGWWKRGANGGYPGWWKTLCIVTITVTLVLGIWPPTAGTVTDAVTASRMDSEIVVPVLLRPADGGLWADARDSRVIIQVDNIVSDTHSGYQTAVVEVRRLTDTHFRGVRTVATDPVLTMPYITGLAERARIIFFHVPMSWVATVAYLGGNDFWHQVPSDQKPGLRSRFHVHDSRGYSVWNPCYHNRCCMGTI